MSITPPPFITVAGHTIELGGSQSLAASDLTNGTTGSGDVVLAASPTLTGTPVAPTAASGTNDTQVASTAYVGRASSQYCVTMYPAATNQSGSIPWLVLDPFGNAISTAGTTTDGLQEAINYAVNNGFPLFVYGQGNNTSGHSLQGSYINCSTSVVKPAMQFFAVYLYNVDLNFTSALGSNPGLVLDTSILSGWYHQGQISYYGTGTAVLIQPKTPDPEDGGTFSGDCWVFISNIAMGTPGADSIVTVDLTYGGVDGGRYEFIELNGINNCTHAFKVNSPPNSTNAWAANKVSIQHAHLITGAAIQIGTSASYQANLFGNSYYIGIIAPAGASAIGIETYESNAIYEVGVINSGEGAFNIGVNVESGAVGNNFVVGTISGQTGVGATAFSDGGTGTNWTLSGVQTMATVNGPASSYLTINSGSGGQISLATNGTQQLNVSSALVYPASDNAVSLGLGSYRFIAVYAVNGTIQTSDLAAKDGVEDSALGLDFVMALKPISWRWREGPDTKRHYGVATQHLEAALADREFGGLYKHEDAESGINYSELIAPLIKAIQEQQQQIDELRRYMPKGNLTPPG